MSPWAAVVLIVVAPQIMGGALDWSVPVIAGLSLVSFVFAIAPHNLRGIGVPRVLWVAIAATVWTGIQLIPLGTWLSGSLSPTRATVQRLLGAALGDLPQTATTISMDAGATQLELMKGCGLLCAFTASYIMSRRGYTSWQAAAIAGAGSLMALVALTHRALDAEQVFGLYTWTLAAPRLPAPILNDNCLAGFLVLTTPVALGLARTSADARVRLAQYLAAFLMAGTGLLTGSRAGTGAMVFALVATVIVTQLRGQSREKGSVASLAWGAIVVAGAIAIAVMVGAEPLLRTLNSDDMSKLDLVVEGLQLSTQQPWFGVGRGGFSAAMTSTMDDGGRFVHAENFPATWLSEWGLPVGAGVLVGAGSALWRLLTARSRLRLAMGIGLLAFAAQNLLDLGLEMSGIATVAAASLGTGLGAADHERAPLGTGWAELGPTSWVIAAFTLASLAWYAPAAFADGDGAGLRRMEEAARSGERAQFGEELARALARHPFEPVLYFAAGREHVNHNDPRALRWLNLAMLRAPLWSAPHVQAARLLTGLGRPGQAALEAREAVALNPAAGAAAACATVLVVRDIELVLMAGRGAKTPSQRRTFYDVVARCLDQELVAQLDRRMIASGTDLPSPYLRESHRTPAGDQTEARLNVLEAGVVATHGEPMLLLAYARALHVAGRLVEAEIQLARAAKATARQDAVATLAAEIATARGDATAMRAEIDQLRAMGAGSGTRLAAAAMLRSRLEAKLGNFDEADDALDEALGLDPSVANLRAALAFANRRGQSAKAARLRESLCRLAPAEAGCP